MSVNFTKNISQLIESQFPDIYREDGEALVAFTKAYYEFLESDDVYSYKLGRQIFEIADVDESLEKFMKHFKETYLADFPYVFASDKRFTIKHISDYYKTKGSKQSLELLMRMLFNEKASIYYPGEDVLRPSDSSWYKPFYLEVTRGSRNASLLNKQITGVKSGAQAFVESVAQKRVKGKVFDVLYLSSLRGNFITGERITDDENIAGAPRVKGSMAEIEISLGGRDNKVGEIFTVVTDEGVQGKVKVSSIRNATGRVDFTLVDGGWGYTADNKTDVYSSDAILFVNDADQYLIYETVYQPIEYVKLASATNVLSANNLVGKYVTSDAGGANGVIVATANTNANGAIVSTASANGYLMIQVSSGTFTDQKQITFSAAHGYQVGEYITEQSEVSLTISNISGTFQVGETLNQIVRESVANTIVSQAFGTIVTANTSAILVRPSWGAFSTTNGALVVGANSNASAVLSAFTVNNPGARAVVNTVTANTATVNVIFGQFDVASQVRGDSTKNIRTISAITTTGASIVFLQGNTSANAVVSQANNAYVEGMVIGANAAAIGVWGNTDPFYVSTSYTPIVKTKRSSLISPPRYSNGAIIDLNSTIERIPGGRGASFEIGVVENIEQNVTIYTDIIGSNNVAGVPYTNVKINGQGSGFGFVQNFTINTGGTGYANNALLSFAGGGFANGSSTVSANAFVTTNTSGGITAITVTVNGEGYYTTPTFTLPATGGTIANVTINMNWGYGFPKNPSAENLNLIGDALTVETLDVGSIGLLSKINPGTEYTADPFVRVRNKYIASYQRRDIVLDVDNVTGSFAVGETINQIVGPSTNFKGRVKSTQISAGSGKIYLERNALSIAFTPGYVIVGETTGTSANILGVSADEESRFIGDNAVITAEAISAQGVATAVEIVDSGFGYIQDGEVQLVREGNPFIITGVSKTGKQGVAEGYWKTTTSHLNSEKKLHDNDYYQEYSYDVMSGLSLNRYSQILNKVLHVSGTKMFGSVMKTSTIDGRISVAGSSISVS